MVTSEIIDDCGRTLAVILYDYTQKAKKTGVNRSDICCWELLASKTSQLLIANGRKIVYNIFTLPKAAVIVRSRLQY